MSIVTKVHNGYKLIQISTTPDPEELLEFLEGKTCPIVEGESNPNDWCYEWDYAEFIRIGLID